MVDYPNAPSGSPPASPPMVSLLTTAELAAHWRLAPRTLQRWRTTSRGPAWLRLGGLVFYRAEDVEAFEARHRHRGG